MKMMADMPHSRSPDSFKSQGSLLAQRERCSKFRGSIGYTFGNVMSFGRVDTLVSHTGCVNSMKWAKDGRSLLTGSDDKTIKIWNYKHYAEGATLKHTVRTGHRSNIFCADFSPICDNIIISCAADGTLYKNDLNSVTPEVRLMRSQGLMHMFIFDVDQPQVVYTAEDSGKGIISRVDLRTNVVEAIFSTELIGTNNPENLPKNCLSRSYTETMSSIKALAQSDVLGGSQLLIGGSKSFSIGLLDLRCLSPLPADWEVSARSTAPKGNPFVKMWSPQSTNNTSYAQNGVNGKSKPSCHGVSISGMCFSSDGTSILASYQGDQIYIFDTFTSTTKSESKSVLRCAEADENYHVYGKGIEMGFEKEDTEETEEKGEESKKKEALIKQKYSKIGARNLLGGHINHATFLKSISFFGPKDEYVVSGSDSGHLWIWDATSGCLDVEEAQDRTCRVVNFLKADDSTCNGAVPHPYAPLLCTYGIASDIKLWACEEPKETPGERIDSPGLHARTCVINKLIAEETEYQGRGIDLGYKQLRSEYCDMDRLHSHLRIQRSSIRDSRNRHSPVVSDPGQYDITTMAIRTDQILKGCMGDALHLSEPYRTQSSLIGPEYGADLVVLSNRNGWKKRFTEENKSAIATLCKDLFLLSRTTALEKTDFSSDLSKVLYAATHEMDCNKLTNKFEIMEEINKLTADELWELVTGKIEKNESEKSEKNENESADLVGDSSVFSSLSACCIVDCEFYRIAQDIKQLGNTAFRNKHSGCARILYEKALRYADSIDENSSAGREWDGSSLTPAGWVSAPAPPKPSTQSRWGDGATSMYGVGDDMDEDEDEDEDEDDMEDLEEDDEDEEEMDEEEEEQEEEMDEEDDEGLVILDSSESHMRNIPHLNPLTPLTPQVRGPRPESASKRLSMINTPIPGGGGIIEALNMAANLTRSFSENLGRKQEKEREGRERERERTEESSSNGKIHIGSENGFSIMDPPPKKERVVEKVELVRGAAQNVFESIHNVVSKSLKEDMAFACLSNLIAADLQAEDFSRAKVTFERSLVYIKNSQSVPIEIHAKLLFRGSCCYSALGLPSQALATLQQALRMMPNDKAMLDKLKEFKSHQDAVSAAEKRKYAKMFSK